MDLEDSKEIQLQSAEITEMISINVICRLCASQSDKLIGIFSEEGCSNDLATKMNLYLPVKVSETDDLPLQCCWQCASTVIAWHDLFVTTVETDRRLRSCQFVTEKQLLEDIYQGEVITEEETNTEIVPDSDNSLIAYCQRENISTDFDKSPKKSTDKKVTVSYEVNSSMDSLNDLVLLKSESYTDDLDDVHEFDSSLGEVSGKVEEVEDSPQGSQEEVVENETVIEYSCEICLITSVSEEAILSHIKECHSDEVVNPSDTVVKKEKIVKGGTKEKRKHNKIDQELVNCAKVVVDGRVYYNCSICKKNLHSPYTYVWHMRIHSGERPYTCDLCGKQFRVSQGLVRHLKETHAKIKNFPCDLCGRMFATKRNVEEHRRIHTNERPYICDMCGKAFKQKASLFVHNRSHSDTFPYKCSYCNQGFRSKPPLLIHVTRHTGEKPYPCQICGRCFRIKYELKRHMLIHSDYKPFSCNLCGMSFRQKRFQETTRCPSPGLTEQTNGVLERPLQTQYICDICDSRFATKAEVENHLTQIHNQLSVIKCQQNYDKCEICAKTFVTNSELTTHMKQHTKNAKVRRKRSEIKAFEFFCDFCNKGFTRKHDSQVHMKKQHPNEKINFPPTQRKLNEEVLNRCRVKNTDGSTTYVCDVCQQPFNRTYHLIRHRSVHTGEKQYFCHLCGKVFRLQTSLKVHISSFHHGVKNYECNICQRKFATSSNLRDHMNIHCDKRPFSCDICPKTFRQAASLRIHKLFHSDEKPFVCEVCGKGYRRVYDLKVHKQLHTGETPYKCGKCEATFRLSSNLRRHERKAHEKSTDCCEI